MAAFIALITSVLGIELSIGVAPDVVTLSLGGIALGVMVLGAGVAFFKKVGGRR